MQSSRRRFSPSVVSRHSSKEDCWLVIHGKVYDVTTFLVDHPGGEDVLIQASASGDATQSFEEVGHSSTATSMMEGYLIGVLEGGYETVSGINGTVKMMRSRAEEAGSSLQQGNAALSYSFMDYFLPLFFLVLAFAAWYYLTFLNVEA